MKRETVRDAEGLRESLSELEWGGFVYIAHSLAVHSCLKMSEEYAMQRVHATDCDPSPRTTPLSICDVLTYGVVVCQV